jgi:ABC-type nitrate/sulfonate/bicarbonate transport system permease component
LRINQILLNHWAIRAYTVIIFLAVWQYLGQSVNPILFSPPRTVAVSFWQNSLNGRLGYATLITLQTTFVGFLVAAALGIGFGLLLGRSRGAEYSVDPYINLIYATPVVAIVPLVGIWFGANYLSSYIIVFITAFFPILINTIAGVKDVSRSLTETGRSFGFTGLGLWKKVVLPSSVPYIMTGLRLGIGGAIIGALLAELFLDIIGLGGLLVEAQAFFQTPLVISGVLIIMALGIGLTEIVKYLEKKVSPWAASAKGVA